ncbi:MAG TPA: hypothetical protein VF572_02345 [Candidatus Saccharimonadales bacterium]|jgi:hypothetical protein
MTNFTGVLVRRQFEPGQKYVQLVFETAEGMKLSLSRNLRMVRSLTIGREYHIKGHLNTVGGKTFVNEPLAMPVMVQPPIKAKRRPLKIVLAVVIPLLAISGGGVYAAQAVTDKSQVQVQNTRAERARPVVTPASSKKTLPATTATEVSVPASAASSVRSTKQSAGRFTASTSSNGNTSNQQTGDPPQKPVNTGLPSVVDGGQTNDDIKAGSGDVKNDEDTGNDNAAVIGEGQEPVIDDPPAQNPDTGTTPIAGSTDPDNTTGGTGN